MYFGTPQILILMLYLLSVGMSIANHGKPKQGTESAVISAIAATIILALLYWGGFFTP